MADEHRDDDSWDLKYRVDEENDFFTELAFHETERWIQAVTRKKLSYPDDLRKSLENGQLLCELLNSLRSGSVKRINQLPTPLAGLDNINVFLIACRKEFNLKDTQLFDPCDLEDLSQRAIAETDYLKKEVERRLKNVAVTIYWLGKLASHYYNGPQLDVSAFSGLINYHGNDINGSEQFHNDPWDSAEHSSAYSSNDGNSKVVTKEGFDHKHTRDSSYESYASYDRISESSIDENSLDNMPVRSDMRRYGSASSLHRSTDLSARFSGNFDSLYSDKDSSLYRSSPDISHGSDPHTRSSSTDSMDGSFHGNHSRQSSGSVENYPTRTTSGQRKVGQSTTDPLKFVKAQSAGEMARQAQIQMEAAAETKSMRVQPGKEDTDWQANLSNWKTKRRRHSEATVKRVGELELTKEPEEKNNKPKTYGQMVQERQVRKGLSISSFYPQEDDDDDDPLSRKGGDKENSNKMNKKDSSWIKATVAKKVEATHMLLSQKLPSFEEPTPRPKLHDRKKSYDDEPVASWVQDSDDEGSSSSKTDDKNSTDTLGDSGIESSKNDSKDELVTVEATDKKEKRDEFLRKFSQESKSGSDKNKSNKSELVNSSNRINNIRKAFEEKEESARVDYQKPNKSFEFSAGNVRNDGLYSHRSLGDISSKKMERPPRLDSATKSYSFPINTAVTSTPNRSVADTKKNYMEKNITISQKPNHSRGFGFSITGGIDKKQQVIVEKVNLGGAADVCELQVNDEIISLNKRDISHLNNMQVKRIISEGVRVGHIELRVKRCLSSRGFGELEDDAFVPDSSFTEHVPKQTNEVADTMPILDEQDVREKPEDTEHYQIMRIRTGRQIPRQPESNSTSWKTLQNQDHDIMEPDVPESQQMSEWVKKTSEEFLKASEKQHTEAAAAKAEVIVQDSERSTVVHMYNQRAPSPDQERPPEEVEVIEKPTIKLTRLSAEITPALKEDVRTEEDSEPEESSEEESDEEKDADVSPVILSQETPPPPLPKQGPPPLPKMGPPPLIKSNEDLSSFQPPDILQRWQRPRPRSELTFDLSVDLTDAEKRMSITFPLDSEYKPKQDTTKKVKDDMVLIRANQDFEATLSDHILPEQKKHEFQINEDMRKMENWETKQHQKRQRPTETQAVTQFSVEKEQLVRDRRQLEDTYQQEMERAENSKRQNDEKDHKILEPEMERVRSMEERHQQRRSRLNQSAPTWQPPSPDDKPQSPLQALTIKLASPGQGRQLRKDPIMQSDPSPKDSQMPEYSFHVNRVENSRGTVVQPEFREAPRLQEIDQAEFLERERERIREQEHHRLEEEKRKWEAEEMQRIKKREEKLRQQEEQLERERRRLKEDQERIQKEREEFERKEREEQERRKNQLHKPVPQTRKSKQSGFDHLPPRSNSPQWSSAGYSATRSVDNSPPSASFDTSRNYSSQKLESTWSTNRTPKNDISSREKTRLTREDMMAMNRKPTPLQKKPDNADLTSANGDNHVTREAPSKEELHSLTAVPKPRLRESGDWISSSRENLEVEQPPKRNRDRRSDIFQRDYSTPQDHWLIREAEHRRLAENSQPELRQLKAQNRHSLNFPIQSGPIKPTVSEVSNRWRDDTHTPVQHLSYSTTQSESRLSSPRALPTALQPRNSRSTDYKEFSAKQHQSDVSLTQTLPANFQFEHSSPKRDLPPAPSKSTQLSANESSNEQVMSISGKQKCSYCSQELGFGAAMVIESLGLYYHVQCFRCCVCMTPLGNGSEGADVRVRVNKLHCRNCYSNDEGKFIKASKTYGSVLRV